MASPRIKMSNAAPSRLLLVAAGILFVVGARPAIAELQQIDPQQSVVTIRVLKTGFLKGLGDNHDIRGTVKEGSINDANPAEVHIVVDAQALRVLDPGTAEKDRAQIQTRMLGPEVLDVNRFPEIRFDSDSAEHSESGAWNVRGRLTLHGQSRALVATVKADQGHYKGSFALRQTDFGITPVSVAGGAVKVKDELRIDFDILTKAARSSEH